MVRRSASTIANLDLARFIEGYRSILQVDGWAAYNKLVRCDGRNDGMALRWHRHGAGDPRTCDDDYRDDKDEWRQSAGLFG